MKLLVLLTLVGIAAAGEEWFSPHAKIMKWMKHKSMAACYGKEAMEVFHIKYKKALKVCTGKPLPELKMFEMLK